MLTKVVNLLDSSREQYYSLEPKKAVAAAFAQSRGDFNTWDYDEKYLPLVEEGKHCFFCGDFATRKFPQPEN